MNTLTNMNIFEFKTDAKGERFCREIANEMVSIFKISIEEAIGRINREWVNVCLIGEQHVLYHETAVFYAKDIYYGHDSKWWKNEERAKPQSYQ
jgi:hypothetical protein